MTPSARLIHGDALAVLRTMEAGSVDENRREHT